MGTHTGIAHNLSGKLVAETWTLASKDEVTSWGKQRLTRRHDPRILRFQERLAGLCQQPDLIIFEDVQFSSYTLQCQLWASFRTVAWLTFPKAFFECVPVQTLKKFATGHGGATKDMMESAYRRRYKVEESGLEGANSCYTLDHNAIDALWLFRWAELKIKI